MSEAVEILIKADDKASAKFAAVSANADKASAKTGNAFKEAGGKAKATTEFLGTLASLSGNSELAGLAGMLAGATEKASAFSEVAKSGGAGALAFKLGLVGLAATAGAVVGKAIGDLIWQTAKFERGMQNAKDAAADLDKQLQTMQATMFANQKGDIELIRDPEQKRAAYKKLLDDLNRDIQTASDVAGKSAREVERWAEAWQITGNRKAYAVQAGEQLAADKERLASLKSQRDEMIKIVGARALENEQIAAANAAKDKSEQYLERLRQEVELLKATREEQIKIEAARNATAEDRGAAEQLMMERDAIIAKNEAMKESEALQKRMAEDAARAAERAAEETLRAQQRIDEAALQAAERERESAAREIQRVDELIGAEEDRLELQRIELELGKEAAKAHALMNEGVDRETALRLAAEDAAIEEDRKTKDEDGKKQNVASSTNLVASQSRLLTRGQSSPMDETNKLLAQAQKHAEQLAKFNEQQLEQQKMIATNTANTLTVRSTT